LNAIVESISVLENEECLNAAYGSNLTIDGEVECDASIMDDQLSFGGVGAVSGPFLL
jgi:taspase (threonine aspartase 1)